MCSAAGGGEVVLHSLAGAAAQPYAVLPDGRLDPLATLPAADHVAEWQPCLILSCHLQPSRPSRGGALFLAGCWADLTADPSVWGHGGAPLCSFTVKAASHRCIQLRAARIAPRWFAIGSGCRPRSGPSPLTNLAPLQLPPNCRPQSCALGVFLRPPPPGGAAAPCAAAAAGQARAPLSYLPPYCSKYGCKGPEALADYFTSLGDEVAAALATPGAHVLLAGDFNAHTGCLPDTADHSALLQAAFEDDTGES